MTGAELKAARKALGLTQGQLAKLIGMAGPVQVGRLERSQPGLDGQPRRVSGQVQAALSLLACLARYGLLAGYAADHGVQINKKGEKVKAKLKNLMTGEIIDVHSTTDSPDSSYGLECWVDDAGRSYGQCQFGAPFGYVFVEFAKGQGQKIDE